MYHFTAWRKCSSQPRDKSYFTTICDRVARPPRFGNYLSVGNLASFYYPPGCESQSFNGFVLLSGNNNTHGTAHVRLRCFQCRRVELPKVKSGESGVYYSYLPPFEYDEKHLCNQCVLVMMMMLSSRPREHPLFEKHLFLRILDFAGLEQFILPK